MTRVTSTMKQIQYGLRSSQLRRMVAVTGLLQESSPDHCYFCQLIFQRMVCQLITAPCSMPKWKHPLWLYFQLIFPRKHEQQFACPVKESSEIIYIFQSNLDENSPMAAWKNADVSFFWNAACETQLQVEAQWNFIQKETEIKSWSFSHWSRGEKIQGTYIKMHLLW